MLEKTKKNDKKSMVTNSNKFKKNAQKVTGVLYLQNTLGNKQVKNMLDEKNDQENKSKNKLLDILQNWSYKDVLLDKEFELNDYAKVTDIKTTTEKSEDGASAQVKGNLELLIDSTTTTGEVSLSFDSNNGVEVSLDNVQAKTKVYGSDVTMDNLTYDEGAILIEKTTMDIKDIKSIIEIGNAKIDPINGFSIGSGTYKSSEDIDVIPDYVQVSDVVFEWGENEFGELPFVRKNYLFASGNIEAKVEKEKGNFDSKGSVYLERDFLTGEWDLDIQDASIQALYLGQKLSINKINYNDGELEAESGELDLAFLNSSVKLGGIKISKEEGISVEDGSYSYKEDIKLIKDHLNLKNVMFEWGKNPLGELPFTGDHYFEGKGELDFTSKKFKGSGKVNVVYDYGEDGFCVIIEDGKVDAEVFGQSLKIDGLEYEDKSLIAKNSVLDIKYLKTKVDLKEVSIDSENGLKIGQGRVELDKELDIIEDTLTLSNPAIDFNQKDDSSVEYTDISGNISFKKSKISADAKEVGIRLKKHEMEGRLKEFDLQAYMFNLKIENALIKKNLFKVDSASARIGSEKDLKDKKTITDIIPGVDLGVLEFVGDSLPSIKAENITINKADGFKIEKITPEMPVVKFNHYGIDAQLDVVNKKGSIKGEYSFPPDNMPGWPFKLEAFYPVIPGIMEVYAYLSSFGKMKVSLGASMKREKGENQPWEIDGNANFNGNLGVSVGGGGRVGSKAIVALGAEIYADASVNLNTDGGLSGAFVYDSNLKKYKKHKDVEAKYDLSAILKSSVGAKVKAEALMFFDKEIIDYKFKEWTLGEFNMAGKVSKGASGKYRHKITKKAGFIGKPKGPSVEYTLKKGEEAENLLKTTSLEIENSGLARKEMIDNISIAYKDSLNIAMDKIEHEKKRLDYYNTKKSGVDKKSTPHLKKHEERLKKIQSSKKGIQRKTWYGGTKIIDEDYTKAKISKYQSQIEKAEAPISKHEQRIEDLRNLIIRSATVLSDVEKAIADIKALEKGQNVGVIEKTENENEKIKAATQKLSESSD